MKNSLDIFNHEMKRTTLYNSLKDQSIFLLCGGPSLKKVNLSLLDSPRIITMAINNAATLFRPNYWIATDIPETFSQDILRDAGIIKFLPTVYDIKKYPNTYQFKLRERFNPTDWFETATFDWGSPSYTPDDVGIISGRSTMLPAIKMCWYLGVSKIYLLGVDFTYSGEDHYAYPWTVDERHISINEHVFRCTRRRLELLATGFNNHNLQLFNCTPNSRLNVIPYCSYEHAIKSASLKL